MNVTRMGGGHQPEWLSSLTAPAGRKRLDNTWLAPGGSLPGDPVTVKITNLILSSLSEVHRASTVTPLVHMRTLRLGPFLNVTQLTSDRSRPETPRLRPTPTSFPPRPQEDQPSSKIREASSSFPTFQPLPLLLSALPDNQLAHDRAPLP